MLIASPLPHTPDTPLPAGWWRHPLTRLVCFLVLLAAGAVTVGLALASLGLGGPWLMAVELVSVVLAYLLVTMGLEGRRPPVELDPRRAGGLLYGLTLGAFGMALVFGLCWALGLREVTGTNPRAPLVQPVLMMGLTAGVAEELVFRGILFRLVERGLGTWGAAGLSGLLFGLVHLGNPAGTWWGAVAIALEAGVMFALLYALTRSLWVVIGVHAAWNVVQGPVLGSAVSGATANGEGLVVSYPVGPELLSGGTFGLEASLVSVLLWCAFSAWLVTQLRPSGRVVLPWWRRRALERSWQEQSVRP
ncbi:CPBP family intramembrane glutamic endopeptidase [Luteococcus sp.]|uniref:CPBP family intramembrane glutamic endopeptidase n=1 Tax=Luteococcus sp. TaxID=1969402 RepID=UPI003735763E